MDGWRHRGIIIRETGVRPHGDRIRSGQRVPQQGQEMRLGFPLGLLRTAFQTGHDDASAGDGHCPCLQVLVGHGNLRRIKVGARPDTRGIETGVTLPYLRVDARRRRTPPRMMNLIRRHVVGQSPTAAGSREFQKNLESLPQARNYNARLRCGFRENF